MVNSVKLFSHLAKLYALESAEATRHYDEQLDQSVRDVADKLLTAAEQERLLEYEVGLKLYERIKKGAIQVVSPTDPKIGSDKVVFPFDGEYWNDELHDFWQLHRPEAIGFNCCACAPPSTDLMSSSSRPTSIAAARLTVSAFTW